MLALSEPLRTAKHLAGRSMTLPPLNAPVPSLGREQSIVKVAKQVGLGVGTVHRLALELRSHHRSDAKPHVQIGRSVQPQKASTRCVATSACGDVSGLFWRACSKPLLINADATSCPLYPMRVNLKDLQKISIKRNFSRSTISATSCESSTALIEMRPVVQ